MGTLRVDEKKNGFDEFIHLRLIEMNTTKINLIVEVKNGLSS